jgi:asparagine synthase (glutamine-hydrolysing)
VAAYIETFPALAPSVPWFVVLPDSAAAAVVAARLAPLAPEQVAHASGRPWIMGSWPAAEACVARAGGVTLMLLGHHAVTAARLRDCARGVGAAADVQGATRSFHGSFHVLASVDGAVCVHGTALGLRCVFRAQLADLTVAADRADVLAALVGADVDPERLALRVMWPPVLHPVADRPVWRGVEAVDPFDSLLVDRTGRGRTVRRWTPPEPSLDLADGAAALREALASAVAARVGEGERLTCDLAGLDSTSLCVLAAQRGARVTALTAQNPDPRDDDVAWGSRTASALPGVEHEVVAVRDMPRFYDDALAMPDSFDEPSSTEMDLARYAAMIRRAARHEPRMHLNGFGGDEALQGALNHLHAMMRSDPRVALGHIRGLRAKFRWSYREIARQLVRDRPYRDWLAATAESLTEPPPKIQTPLLDWSWPPRFAPWITPAAVEAARDAIRREIATAQPLAPSRGLHFDLEAMRSGARGARRYDQLARRVGVATSAPFYDDHVVEAALAVRPEHRLNPWRYKPLIAAAMRDIAPPGAVDRVTKADWSVAHEAGLRANRDALLRVAEDSRLEALGILDVAELRRIFSRPLPPSIHPALFDATASCERWLRVAVAASDTPERRTYEHQAA